MVRTCPRRLRESNTLLHIVPLLRRLMIRRIEWHGQECLLLLSRSVCLSLYRRHVEEPCSASVQPALGARTCPFSRRMGTRQCRGVHSDKSVMWLKAGYSNIVEPCLPHCSNPHLRQVDNNSPRDQECTRPDLANSRSCFLLTLFLYLWHHVLTFPKL